MPVSGQIAAQVTVPGTKRAFTEGICPATGDHVRHVKADVLERYVPGFERGNFVDLILDSDWPE
jgi:hypothetical protein